MVVCDHWLIHFVKSTVATVCHRNPMETLKGVSTKVIYRACVSYTVQKHSKSRNFGKIGQNSDIHPTGRAYYINSPLIILQCFFAL